MQAGHLTAPQRNMLRRALEAKRAELLRDVDRHEREAADDATDSVELEDIAEGIIEDRARRRLEERDRTELEEVDHALTKFDSGQYGLSEASEKPIPFERLKAIPWARYDEQEAEGLERAPHGAR